MNYEVLVINAREVVRGSRSGGIYIVLRFRYRMLLKCVVMESAQCYGGPYLIGVVVNDFTHER